MATICKGTWVEVERVLLKPEERAPNLPADTAKVPYVLRVSGFLLEDADLGQQVKIRTIIGQVHSGKLRIQNPGYGHSFGHTVPELLKIGRGGLA
jgi:hypothetical protein